jgi:hypothetical protein
VQKLSTTLVEDTVAKAATSLAELHTALDRLIDKRLKPEPGRAGPIFTVQNLARLCLV